MAKKDLTAFIHEKELREAELETSCNLQPLFKEPVEESCPDSYAKFYPFIDWKSMPQEEQQKTFRKLEDNATAVYESFADLIMSTLFSFIDRNVNPRQLWVYINALGSTPIMRHDCDKEQLFPKLKNAECIESVFMWITDHTSWLHPQLLEYIINDKQGKFGSDSDRKALEDYKNNHLKPFLENSIIAMRTTIHPLSSTSCSKDMAELVLKIPDKRIKEAELKGYDLVEIQNNLQRLLDVKPGTLILRSYKKGCIELVFTVPSEVLTDCGQKTALKSNVQWDEKRKMFWLTMDTGEILPRLSKPSSEIPVHVKVSNLEKLSYKELYEKGQTFSHEFKNAVSAWKITRQATIDSLKLISKKIRKHRKNINYTRMSGAAVSIVGGVTATAGFILIPFTFGTSVIVTGIGVGVGVVGGSMAAGAKVADLVIEISQLKRVQQMIDEDRKLSTKINDLYKKLMCIADSIHLYHHHLTREQILHSLFTGKKALAHLGVVSCFGQGIALTRGIGSAGIRTGPAMLRSGPVAIRVASAGARGIAIAGVVLNVVIISIDIIDIIYSARNLKKGCNTNATKKIQQCITELEEDRSNFMKYYVKVFTQ